MPLSYNDKRTTSSALPFVAPLRVTEGCLLMNSYFDQLGRTVLERWREPNFSLEVFPELARIALDESPPSENVDLEELVQEFLCNDEQPFQSISGFGQPELVAFNDKRFYVQILFWLDGTTETSISTNFPAPFMSFRAPVFMPNSTSRMRNRSLHIYASAIFK